MVDLRVSQVGEGSAWYPQLRWPLTLAITTSLVLVTLLS